MQSDTYWSKRLQELDVSLSKDEKQLFSELSKYYEQEYAALDKEIAAYYAKYGEENVIAFRTLLLELPDADKQLLLQNMDEFAKQYPEFADLLPVRESIYKLNRLEGLQTSIVLQQLKIGAIEQAKFREHFEKQALKYANYAAEQLGFGTNFYRIDSEMLQVVIGNPWCNGKDFSERIWANREALAQTLQNEIANGLIRGEDYRTMSRILQQKFENTSQKQAERLVFTEDTYLSNEAKIRPFERNAAYTHYEYLCVEDHRTCETCRALSGQTFEISKRNAGLNFPPMHPWCRCTVMPVVEDLATIKRRLNADSGSGKSDAILLTDTRKDGIIKTKQKKYKSKYSADERAERSKKAKEVIERVLSALHFDENGKILDEVVYTASGEEVKIVEKTTLQDKPNSITQIVNAKGGVNRNYYDENGNQFLQISNNGHGHPVEEDLGEFGEHAHNYYFDENNKLKRTDARELTEEERKRNDDML